MTPASPGTLHHVELWVPDLGRACSLWGRLLGELGYTPSATKRVAIGAL